MAMILNLNEHLRDTILVEILWKQKKRGGRGGGEGEGENNTTKWRN